MTHRKRTRTQAFVLLAHFFAVDSCIMLALSFDLRANVVACDEVIIHLAACVRDVLL